ncbi:transcriptional regulator [Bacillus xiamenensis]|nr:transcriptional regulator [Bacillus xiamenensis]
MGPDATDWMIKNIQGKKNLPDQTFYEPELIPGETIKQLNARKK